MLRNEIEVNECESVRREGEVGIKVGERFGNPVLTIHSERHRVC